LLGLPELAEQIVMVCNGLVYHRRIMFTVIEEGKRFMKRIIFTQSYYSSSKNPIIIRRYPWIKYMAINPKQIVYQKFTI